MVMKFRPELPMHDRYEVAHEFLTPEVGDEVVTISRLVNAFFRWEFNSCENLVAGTEVHPIDYANACPDVALTSLHYYFPWAMTALVRWTVFTLVSGRQPGADPAMARYFAIADRDDLSYREKLAAYRRLADDYFETDRYLDFCASRLSHLDEVVLEWVDSADFDALLLDTVRSTYPLAEYDRFVAHFRGLVGLWVRDAKALATVSPRRAAGRAANARSSRSPWPARGGGRPPAVADDVVRQSRRGAPTGSRSTSTTSSP
jgi:hypothetical protein